MAELDPIEEALGVQALLYACAELNADEATAFEVRLAGEQSAREALALAVGSLPPLFDHAGPHPSYRRRVRARLSPQDPRRPRQLFWSLTGVAAAVAAFVFVSLGKQLFAEPAGLEAPVVQTVPSALEDSPAARQEAVRFAELTTVERLSRIHEEEALRKRKHEGRRPRQAEESARPMSPMMPPISPASMM